MNLAGTAKSLPWRKTSASKRLVGFSSSSMISSASLYLSFFNAVVFFSFLSINSGFWRLRRDSRSSSWGGRRRRWVQCVTMTSSVPSLSCAHISLCVCVQVTALRRQVRPTSGKVIRKVNLSEQTVQDSTHRPPSGRMYPSGSAAPNGNRWVFV